MEFVSCQISGDVKHQKEALYGIMRVLHCNKGSSSGKPALLEVSENILRRNHKACPEGQFLADADIDVEFKLSRIAQLTSDKDDPRESTDKIPVRWRLKHQGRMKPSELGTTVCWFKASDMPITSNAQKFLHSMGFRPPAIKAPKMPVNKDKIPPASMQRTWTVLRWFARVSEAAGSRRMMITGITECHHEVTELGTGVMISLRFPKPTPPKPASTGSSDAEEISSQSDAKTGPMESALNAAASAATKGELEFKMVMCGNLPDKDKNCAFLQQISRPYQAFVDFAAVALPHT